MAWISKKAKAQMRSRRKKKEKSDLKRKREDDDNDDANANNDNDANNTNTNNDTNNNEESSNVTKTNSAGTKTKIANVSTSDNWTTIQKDTIISITLTSKLTSKEAKKLRKETRRKARKEGRDENLIKFVDEDGVPMTFNTDSKVDVQENSESAEKGDDGDDENNNNSNNNNGDDEHKNSEGGDADGDGDDSRITKKQKTRKKSFPNINQLLADAEKSKKENKEKEKRQSYEDSIPEETKSQYVALDCEMVGIGAEGKQSALARVSITNWSGDIILDTFVQVPDRVTDFRTFVSGVRAKDIRITNQNSMELHACRKKVGEIIKSKILVGHSLKNDFAALMLGHPKHLIRDTARYKPFMRASGRNGGKLKPRKLKDLVKENVGMVIQKEGEAHTSVEDAQATMNLYKVVREPWEKEIEKADAAKSRSGKRKR